MRAGQALERQQNGIEPFDSNFRESPGRIFLSHQGQLPAKSLQRATPIYLLVTASEVINFRACKKRI